MKALRVRHQVRWGLSLMLLGWLMPTALFAQSSYTWTGGGDGTSWNNSNNWNPNGVPNGTTVDVIFPSVSPTLTNIPVNTQVRDFTLSGTSNVTLNGDLNIGRNLSVPNGCTFTAASGTTVKLNGNSVTQDIGGAGTTQFHNLTIEKLGSDVQTTIVSLSTV
ncbi:MAG: hypothetical protein CMR00_04105 [[Chlorobium] sp. 445]|nr:MAG: hypothetical protein CMR00_04105 [[Chlorobium] sp. 445]